MYIDIVKYAHLLARLGYEDDFRQRFVADPGSVLTNDMGIALNKEDLSELANFAAKLPSKEILQKEYEDRLKRFVFALNMPGYAAI